MKTVTITLHDTENCGSSLQAFALQRYLKDCGIENEIINYAPPYTQNSGSPIRTLARKIIFPKATIIRKRKFQEFIREHLVLTKRKYTSLEQLKQAPPTADCYITGSDQLWNTMYACGRDPAFYLDFADGKKIAYAVSLGREVVPQDNLDTVKRYISDFDAVSVREASSVKQIGGLYGKNVAFVCDPVLLNPVSAYDPVRTQRMVKEPYILVYVAQGIDDEVLNKWIDKVNESKKRAVVFIGAYRRKCRCDHHFREVSPGEFLSLICYADYVISNSFHATLFSLMYQRQFATIAPAENGARMRGILSYVGLGAHAVGAADGLPDDITDERYAKVIETLRRFASASREWLKNALSADSTAEDIKK